MKASFHMDLREMQVNRRRSFQTAFNFAVPLAGLSRFIMACYGRCNNPINASKTFWKSLPT